MKNILAIDIGTTSVKAIIMDGGGKVLAEAASSHPLVSGLPGWSEEMPDLWLAGAAEAMAALRTQAPQALADVAVVGTCGMVPAIVLLDEKGRPVRYAILQNDARCTEQIRRLQGGMDQNRLFERTGGFTNQQHVLPRLLWVKEHEPDVWARTAHVVGSYDFINYVLTGELAIEKNWAVESGMWDIKENRWIGEMLEFYGIDASLLPPVHEPSEIVGTVKPPFSEIFGIPEGTPVIAGSADHVAATLACGIAEQGDLLIKFGGAGDILFCTDEPVTDPRLFFDFHDIPGKYLLNGCMAASGSLLKWYAEGILGGAASYAELDAEAEKIPAGSDGLIVLPYFLGEKTPIMDPAARGVFFGLTLSHTRAHIYRAILESVIFGFRHHLEVMKEKGIEPVRIYAADGGAKSPLWCQIAADILGRPVEAFRDGTGSAYGTALLAGRSVGIIEDWSSIKKLLPQPVVYTPNPENTAQYNKNYEIYRRLYENNKELMHSL